MRFSSSALRGSRSGIGLLLDGQSMLHLTYVVGVNHLAHRMVRAHSEAARCFVAHTDGTTRKTQNASICSIDCNAGDDSWCHGGSEDLLSKSTCRMTSHSSMRTASFPKADLRT